LAASNYFTEDYPGCWDIVSWCMDPYNVDMPPLEGNVDLDITCSYTTGIPIATPDQCRSEVMPQNEQELTVEFACPVPYETRWRDGVANDQVKKWTCPVGANEWKADATGQNWPICGE